MRRLVRRPFLFTAVVLVLGAAGGAGAFVATRHASATEAGSTGGSPHVAPLRLVSSTPASGAQDVPFGDPITVSFDVPILDPSVQPTLNPPVPGTWSLQEVNTLQFVPSVSLPPGASETITIPGGSSGVTGTNGSHLAGDVSIPFSVAPMSTLRTQQLLAELGYLPLTFTPASSSSAGSAAPGDESSSAGSSGPGDEAGSFAWKWSTFPAALTSLWNEGQPNAITTGAIMAFESQHGLSTDGDAGPHVWQALLSAAAAHQNDSDPNYDWVDVSTSIPESVTVWRNGAAVYSTPANTGIEGATTALGTWPVYVRYTSTTMSGTNPDGSHYDDPGVPWVSYFHGGDALHGFIRSSYGTPQSLGCVEMPPANAAVVYPFTPLGTLVTVQ
jgi:peptidoglycan hydrolase-like protein with peptidoglycan-binding domain